MDVLRQVGLEVIREAARRRTMCQPELQWKYIDALLQEVDRLSVLEIEWNKGPAFPSSRACCNAVDEGRVSSCEHKP
jgi:hypothetical protein